MEVRLHPELENVWGRMEVRLHPELEKCFRLASGVEISMGITESLISSYDFR